MKRKLYNDAWSALEPILFEHLDLHVDEKVMRGQLTIAEADNIQREYYAVVRIILEDFGVTFDELEKETDSIMEKLRNGKKSRR